MKTKPETAAAMPGSVRRIILRVTKSQRREIVLALARRRQDFEIQVHRLHERGCTAGSWLRANIRKVTRLEDMVANAQNAELSDRANHPRLYEH